MSTLEFERIPAGLLSIDPALQRNLDHRRVAKMSADFDVEALGILTVSLRKDGLYYIMDGQHRWRAAMLALGEDVELLCKVFYGLGAEDEAAGFRKLNNTHKPHTVDAFRIGVAEGLKDNVEIDRMVRESGLFIRLGHGNGVFSAVGAATRIYALDPTAVDRSLRTIVGAWGLAETDGRTFEGLGLVYVRDGDAVDLPGMVKQLTGYPNGQRGLLNRAVQMRDYFKLKVPHAVAEIAVDQYNMRRRTSKLPPWRP